MPKPPPEQPGKPPLPIHRPPIVHPPIHAPLADLPPHAQPRAFPDDSIARPSERDLLAQLRKQLPALLEREQGGRKDRFYPYLLVRAQPGDRGDRPLKIVPNELFGSPDIWLAKGPPDATPPIPADRGPVGVAPKDVYTVYAHVWNLGRAPILGVAVDFWWFTDNFSDTDMNANDKVGTHLGMARVDLPPRNSPLCHTLVKCPNPWTVPNLPIGFDTPFTLVARISGVGDRYADQYRWDMQNDRHVAVATKLLL